MARLASLIRPQNTTELLGQGPSLPEMPLPMGYHTGSLCSPHPHCLEQLFSWKKQSIQHSLHTSELETSNAASCGYAMKD